MEKGDVVLIKASGNEPGVRRVWAPDTERPFVCLEDYWLRWRRHSVEPVCWPISSTMIFLFDEGLYSDLAEAFRSLRQGVEGAQQRLEGLWEQAKRY